MKMNLKFTNNGKLAIQLFTNEELLEIFNRYMNTLTKKYDIEVTIPVDWNQSIAEDGSLKVVLANVKCEVEVFFKELGRDIKVPLKKRQGGKLDTVFKLEKME
ncbi:hypothetical protein [Paenibacillus sp. MBLB4367]|uniref:hypothetical protein n=1 Tax=Paenibacillus sp. MBLB4367 TaxID=3384767 RepID=UPI00390833FE